LTTRTFIVRSSFSTRAITGFTQLFWMSETAAIICKSTHRARPITSAATLCLWESGCLLGANGKLIEVGGAGGGGSRKNAHAHLIIYQLQSILCCWLFQFLCSWCLNSSRLTFSNIKEAHHHKLYHRIVSQGTGSCPVLQGHIATDQSVALFELHRYRPQRTDAFVATSKCLHLD
jgi:hypothetical protein